MQFQFGTSCSQRCGPVNNLGCWDFDMVSTSLLIICSFIIYNSRLFLECVCAAFDSQEV